MVTLIRHVLNPVTYKTGFAISYEYSKIREQLEPLPLQYDGDKMYLPPKNKKNPTSKEVTLQELLGCSPDEADSFALAVFRMMVPIPDTVAGAVT